MIRPAQIALALMGGGMVMYSVAPPPNCAMARFHRAPNADDICHTEPGTGGGGWYSRYYGTSHPYFSSGYSGGHSSGVTSVSTSSSARGGFGASGGHASAGS